MSGGHFDYNQYKIGYIADEVDQLIRNNNWQRETFLGPLLEGRAFSAETIAEFDRALVLLRQAQIYAQRIDWLVSGDDSEDSFHARLQEELKNV